MNRSLRSSTMDNIHTTDRSNSRSLSPTRQRLPGLRPFSLEGIKEGHQSVPNQAVGTPQSTPAGEKDPNYTIHHYHHHHHTPHKRQKTPGTRSLQNNIQIQSIVNLYNHHTNRDSMDHHSSTTTRNMRYPNSRHSQHSQHSQHSKRSTFSGQSTPHSMEIGSHTTYPRFPKSQPNMAIDSQPMGMHRGNSANTNSHVKLPQLPQLQQLQQLPPQLQSMPQIPSPIWIPEQSRGDTPHDLHTRERHVTVADRGTVGSGGYTGGTSGGTGSSYDTAVIHNLNEEHHRNHSHHGSMNLKYLSPSYSGGSFTSHSCTSSACSGNCDRDRERERDRDRDKSRSHIGELSAQQIRHIHEIQQIQQLQQQQQRQLSRDGSVNSVGVTPYPGFGGASSVGSLMAAYPGLYFDYNKKLQDTSMFDVNGQHYHVQPMSQSQFDLTNTKMDATTAQTIHKILTMHNAHDEIDGHDDHDYHHHHHHGHHQQHQQQHGDGHGHGHNGYHNHQEHSYGHEYGRKLTPQEIAELSSKNVALHTQEQQETELHLQSQQRLLQELAIYDRGKSGHDGYTSEQSRTQTPVRKTNHRPVKQETIAHLSNRNLHEKVEIENSKMKMESKSENRVKRKNKNKDKNTNGNNDENEIEIKIDKNDRNNNESKSIIHEKELKQQQQQENQSGGDCIINTSHKIVHNNSSTGTTGQSYQNEDCSLSGNELTARIPLKPNPVGDNVDNDDDEKQKFEKDGKNKKQTKHGSKLGRKHKAKSTLGEEKEEHKNDWKEGIVGDIAMLFLAIGVLITIVSVTVENAYFFIGGIALFAIGIIVGSYSLCCKKKKSYSQDDYQSDDDSDSENESDNEIANANNNKNQQNSAKNWNNKDKNVLNAQNVRNGEKIQIGTTSAMPLGYGIQYISGQPQVVPLGQINNSYNNSYNNQQFAALAAKQNGGYNYGDSFYNNGGNSNNFDMSSGYDQAAAYNYYFGMPVAFPQQQQLQSQQSGLSYDQLGYQQQQYQQQQMAELEYVTGLTPGTTTMTNRSSNLNSNSRVNGSNSNVNNDGIGYITPYINTPQLMQQINMLPNGVVYGHYPVVGSNNSVVHGHTTKRKGSNKKRKGAAREHGSKHHCTRNEESKKSSHHTHTKHSKHSKHSNHNNQSSHSNHSSHSKHNTKRTRGHGHRPSKKFVKNDKRGNYKYDRAHNPSRDSRSPSYSSYSRNSSRWSYSSYSDSQSTRTGCSSTSLSGAF